MRAVAVNALALGAGVAFVVAGFTVAAVVGWAVLGVVLALWALLVELTARRALLEEVLTRAKRTERR